MERPALAGPRPRPRTSAPTNRRRDRRGVTVVDSPLPHQPRREPRPLGQAEEESGTGLNHNSNYRRPNQKAHRNRTGARTAEPSLTVTRGSHGGDGSRGFGGGSDSKRHVVATGGGSGDTWPGFLGQIVPSGVEAIAGLPLSGDERNEFAAKTATAAAAISPSLAGAATKNNRGKRRPSVPQFPSTHEHEGPERAALSGATNMAAPSSLVPEKAGNPTIAYSALTSPASPATVVAVGEVGVRSTASQEEAILCSQQWGGFGPGYTPKYFRGRFGVAGERKRLVRRQRGDVDVEDFRSGSTG